MAIQTGKMPCPNCGETIEFELAALIRGSSFSCSNCDTVIGMDTHDHDLAIDALDKMKAVKAAAEKMKGLGKDD